MEQRLDAMLRAVQTVQPALDKFYASLSDEQKERFNRLVPHKADATKADLTIRGGPTSRSQGTCRSVKSSELAGSFGEFGKTGECHDDNSCFNELCVPRPTSRFGGGSPGRCLVCGSRRYLCSQRGRGIECPIDDDGDAR